jgi:hypothetical protein
VLYYPGARLASHQIPRVAPHTLIAANRRPTLQSIMLVRGPNTPFTDQQELQAIRVLKLNDPSSSRTKQDAS